MTGLGQDEALELSSCHAFCKAAPETPYKRACRGHPLALEVIGAQLFDKESNDIQCWEEAVHNIGENPDIPRILQTSFDGLSHIEKEIFLDIACCFVGQRKRDTDLFWEEQNDDNSRLWLPVGAHKDLNRDRAERMKMLVYTGQNASEPVIMHSMPSLHYLFLQNTKVTGNIAKLAPNFIWIKIRNCEIVSDTHTWIMSRNRVQLDGRGSQVRMLSLQECASLTKIPKMLDSLVNLQCLYMGYNKAHKTIPDSLGNLSQLKKLKLCSCRSLTSLPDTVGNLVRLKELCLGSCTDLKSLPDTLGNLAELEELNLYGCKGLRSLPNTICGLAQLRVLNLYRCSGLQRFPYTVGKLPKLMVLNLHRCSGLGSFHHIVAKLAQLKESNRKLGAKGVQYLPWFLCTGSLRIWRSREDDQSGDIRRASEQ
ncbi:hypothetical protein SUGI_0034470 [Cryptomeria japonica]|nr:hypothetical protein SUGI_0034470 [Cryptomeria japonica]